MSTETSSSVLKLERVDSVAVLRLNRPDAMNALSCELRQALASAFRSLQEDETVTAAILTGNGRAFCAGLDLKELARDGIAAVKLGSSEDMMGAILEFDRPIIGAVNGVATTGGFELALMCDVLLASPEARFADTHARVGVIPGWRLSQLLSRIIGINRARELHFTGNFLSAEQAERWGLVNRVVPAEELVPTALSLARDMASCDQPTLRTYKRLVNQGYEMSLGDALTLEMTTNGLSAGNATSDLIGQRVAGVQARGRTQTSP